jgi:hypothetical protein
LLESGKCLAVLHSLPICRPENGKFIPRYTLYLITYFSEDPKSAYDSLIGYNVPYVEPGTIVAFILPQKGSEHWWDLSRWVSAGQLYWVDVQGAQLSLATSDVEKFPYKGITGRRYFHMFPYPYPPPWAHNEYGLCVETGGKWKVAAIGLPPLDVEVNEFRSFGIEHVNGSKDLKEGYTLVAK